jgi:hypothetical protein
MFSPCNTLEYLVEWTLKFQQCARLVLGFYKLQTKRVPLTPKTKYQSKSTTFPRPMYHSLAQLYPSPPNTLYVINKNVSRLTRSKLPSLSLHFLPPPHKPLPSTTTTTQFYSLFQTTLPVWGDVRCTGIPQPPSVEEDVDEV